MENGRNFVVFALIAITLRGGFSQMDNCQAVQNFSSANLVCRFPTGCCSRLLCPISAGLGGNLAELDIRINPCSTPTTLDIIVTEGDSVIFNRSGISTSQSIPVRYEGILDESIDLFFNSSMDSVTIGLTTFGIVLLPPTTIPVDSTGCSAGMSQPPACFAVQPTAVPTQPGPSPVSDATCQALLQLAGGANIASVTNPNQCQVNQECTAVNCNNYFGVFRFTLTLLTCNNPPGINFVAYDGDNNLVFDETVTDSRSIQVDPVGTIIINVNHPCGQDAIIAEVLLSTTFSNATVFPATVIPIDRSDCTNVATTVTPCMKAPTSFNDVCDAVQSGIQSTASTCTTNYPECTSTTCDLNGFNIPSTFGYTILPCTAVPSVRFTVVNDGMVIADQTLSESQVQTITVGPTNVSVRFVVEQDPPLYQTIGVGVNLVSTDPEIDVPVFPLTQIPLDRCSCSNITCTTIPEVDPGSNRDSNTSNDNSSVIIPAVIAAILFVILVVVVAVSIVLLLLLKRSHKKDLQRTNISYSNLKAQEDSQSEKTDLD